MFIVPIIIFVLSIVLYLLYKAYSVKMRRFWIMWRGEKEFPSWIKELEGSFEVFSSLTPVDQKILLKKIAVFLDEKFSLRSQIPVSRLLLSARACLPIVHRKANFYPNLIEGIEEIDQRGWFVHNFGQFRVEMGKLAAKEMESSFADDSYIYFYQNGEALKLLGEYKFDLLGRFYNGL